MADLSKKLLDTKLSEYKNYNKFILGEKELIKALWLEEPLVKSIKVDFVGL